MKIVIALALVFAMVGGTGCVVVGPRRATHSAVAAKKCPPGHQWSDGRCHSTGRGNERRER